MLLSLARYLPHLWLRFMKPIPFQELSFKVILCSRCDFPWYADMLAGLLLEILGALVHFLSSKLWYPANCWDIITSHFLPCLHCIHCPYRTHSLWPSRDDSNGVPFQMYPGSADFWGIDQIMSFKERVFFTGAIRQSIGFPSIPAAEHLPGNPWSTVSLQLSAQTILLADHRSGITCFKTFTRQPRCLFHG